MMQSPPAKLKAHVLELVRNAPSLTRRELVRRQVVILLSYASIFVAASSLRGSSPWQGRPSSYLLVSVLSFGAFVLLGLRMLARFLATPLGPPRESLRRLTRALLPSLSLGALLANLAAPETLTWPIAQLDRHLLCPALLLVLGCVFAWLLTLALRGADPVRPRVTALAIGSTAGATAALAVTLQCHLADPVHALLSHALPVVVLLWLSRGLASRINPA